VLRRRRDARRSPPPRSTPRSPPRSVRRACACGSRVAAGATTPSAAGMPPHRAAGNGGRRRDAASAGLYYWCRTELEMLCRCLDVLPLWISRRSSGTALAARAVLTGCENLARIFDANHSALQRAISNSIGMIRPRYQRLRMSSMSGLVTITATCVLLKRRLQPISLVRDIAAH
jgi:hypothetical protein